jgi:DNA polymerase-3 subunit alpha
VNRRVVESLIKAGAFDGLGAKRSQMMAVIEAAMEGGQNLRRNRELGQEDFFSRLGGRTESARPEPDRYPELEEWEKGELLGYEKEVLGFYLSGHPIIRYQHLIERLGAVPVQDLAGSSPDRSVVVAGIISGYSERNTRKGERMANFKLEDLSGRVEVVVFPSAYQVSQKVLKETDQPVIVKGKVRHEEATRLFAEKVMSIGQTLEELAGVLHVWISAERASEELFNRLRDLLSEHPGKSRVVMHLLSNGGEAVLSLPDRFGTRVEEVLLEKIDGIFGAQTAQIELKLN